MKHGPLQNANTEYNTYNQSNNTNNKLFKQDFEAWRTISFHYPLSFSSFLPPLLHPTSIINFLSTLAGIKSAAPIYNEVHCHIDIPIGHSQGFQTEFFVGKSHIFHDLKLPCPAVCIVPP
ncbi:hypothetical protein, unlikely, partial [Trypanosoma congolense IL3000]